MTLPLLTQHQWPNPTIAYARQIPFQVGKSSFIEEVEVVEVVEGGKTGGARKSRRKTSFHDVYDRYYEIHRHEEAQRKKLQKHIDGLEKTDAEIAGLLHQRELREQMEARLADLGELVEKAGIDELGAVKEYSVKVGKAYERAVKQGNFSALQALEREMNRAREEEEFLLLSVALLE
jgi:hypothetical protein